MIEPCFVLLGLFLALMMSTQLMDGADTVLCRLSSPYPRWRDGQDHGGSAPRLREVSKGTGACCGASALDARFLRAVAGRVPVFAEFRRRHPADAARLLLHTWEALKRGYAGEGPCVVELPAALVQMWSRHRAEFYAEQAGAEARTHPRLHPPTHPHIQE